MNNGVEEEEKIFDRMEKRGYTFQNGMEDEERKECNGRNEIKMRLAVERKQHAALLVGGKRKDTLDS